MAISPASWASAESAVCAAGPAPVVAVQVWVDVGAALEADPDATSRLARSQRHRWPAGMSTQWMPRPALRITSWTLAAFWALLASM